MVVVGTRLVQRRQAAAPKGPAFVERGAGPRWVGHDVRCVGQRSGDRRCDIDAEARAGDVLLRTQVRDSAGTDLFAVTLEVRDDAVAADLLTVPSGDDDRPRRLPAGLRQIAQSACCFQQRDDARTVVAQTVDPRVAVGAKNHALDGQRTA